MRAARELFRFLLNVLEFDPGIPQEGIVQFKELFLFQDTEPSEFEALKIQQRILECRGMMRQGRQQRGAKPAPGVFANRDVALRKS